MPACLGCKWQAIILGNLRVQFATMGCGINPNKDNTDR